MNNNVKLYTVAEAAKILKSNKNYVYGLIRSNLLPALKLGSLKIREEALSQFLLAYENHDLTDPSNVVRIDLSKVAS